MPTRYLYPGAILVLLVLVEIVGLRRVEGPKRAPGGGRAAGPVVLAAAGAAVFVIAMVSNVAALSDRDRPTTAPPRRSRAPQFGAFDQAREGRSPEERAAELDESVEQSSGWLALMLRCSATPTGSTRSRSERLPTTRSRTPTGSPSSDAAELARALGRGGRAGRPGAGRLLSADARARRPRPRPVAGPPSAAPGPRRRWRFPAGVLLIEAAGAEPPAVTVGRFSGIAVQPLPWPQGARSALLALPPTEPGSAPWQVLVGGARSVRRCPGA